jgi:hypothetical protein
MDRDEPVLRVATLDDRSAVDALTKESAAAHFPRTYDERQSERRSRGYLVERDVVDGWVTRLQHPMRTKGVDDRLSAQLDADTAS